MKESKYEIRISADTLFVEAQSDPAAGRYVFAYTITIENTGTITAQLLNRHWIITDSRGRVQEVRGEGVVGQQPVLPPGGTFRYTSAAVLETPVGRMSGAYDMQAEDGHRFDAPIPAFSLSVPRVLH